MTSGRAVAGVLLVVALAGCGSTAPASVSAGQRAGWTTYRRAATTDLDRVLGPTDGLADECTAMLRTAPKPRFGIDLAPTLRRCAAGDLSDARMLAHRQIDHIATNDRALGLVP